ncbi:hypothetical protein AGMMS49975_30150 [Clostridia bacterium]|nr:hypothetical protein AGMMS49975_30150 [Clostridia bacterium]
MSNLSNLYRIQKKICIKKTFQAKRCKIRLTAKIYTESEECLMNYKIARIQTIVKFMESLRLNNLYLQKGNFKVEGGILNG